MNSLRKALLLVAIAVSLMFEGLPASVHAQAQAQPTPTAGPPTSYIGYPSSAQEPNNAAGTTASAIGIIQFDPYLTQAQITFYLTGLDPSQITAFHLHCGLPSQLGPLVVNFNIFGDFTQTFNNGVFAVTLNDGDIEEQVWPINKNKLPKACLANSIGPAPTTTIAGLDALAREGQLYFNVHTGSGKDPTFVYGLIRGQIYPVVGMTTAAAMATP